MSALSTPYLAPGMPDIVADVCSKGVRLWSENGTLHYRAPRGALSVDEVNRLRACSQQIVALLETAASPSAAADSIALGRQNDSLPLSYSQFKYWYSDLRHGRPSIRTISSATSLRGRLDVGLLRSCLALIVGRHEALRTQIAASDMRPIQKIRAASSCDVPIEDISRLTEHGRSEGLANIIRDLVLEPTDVASAPLLAVRLIRLAADEHVLAIAIEHIVSDAYSMGLVLGELSHAYLQADQGKALELPQIGMQMADYAAWQYRSHASWLARHGSYWKERLAGAGRLRFADSAPPGAGRGLGAIRVELGPDIRTQLIEWCRVQRTTVVMAVFTAFVALVLRWYGVREGVIRYQTDGRNSPLVSNTVGYLAAVLNLRLELSPADTFVDLLARTTREYCDAHEHADLSCIDAQVPPPPFTRNPGFNWVPRESGEAPEQRTRLTGHLSFAPQPFVHPGIADYRRDHEPMLVLYDKGDVITGSVCFPENLFAAESMALFARNFVALLRALLTQPNRPVRDLPLDMTPP
jgi:hypothetical protein